MSHPWSKPAAPVAIDAMITRAIEYPSERAYRDCRRAFARRGWHYTTIARCAARYAILTGCSQTAAASVFDIAPGTVSRGMSDIRITRSKAR